MSSLDLNNHVRLVILGTTEVGKTSILSQFLHQKFEERYKPTIDDFYSRTFLMENTKIKVDFLDTSGDDEFPVMRHLSISSSDGFILVYSVTSASSLDTVKTRLQEMVRLKEKCEEVPILIVGNKCDIKTSREVSLVDVEHWIMNDYPNFQISALECSARTNQNITNIFFKLWQLSKVKKMIDNFTRSCLIERRASAYARMNHSKIRNDKKILSLSSRSSTVLNTDQKMLLSPLPPLSPVSPSSFLCSILSPKCSRRSPTSKSSSPSPRSPSLKPSSVDASKTQLIFDFNFDNPHLQCHQSRDEASKSISSSEKEMKRKSRSKSLSSKEIKNNRKHNSREEVHECYIS